MDGLFDDAKEAVDRSDEIGKLFKGTFETELGKRCLTYLEDVFVNRDMYVKGMTLDEVAFRQGEASVVKKILKEFKNG